MSPDYTIPPTTIPITLHPCLHRKSNVQIFYVETPWVGVTCRRLDSVFSLSRSGRLGSLLVEFFSLVLTYVFETILLDPSNSSFFVKPYRQFTKEWFTVSGPVRLGTSETVLTERIKDTSILDGYILSEAPWVGVTCVPF